MIDLCLGNFWKRRFVSPVDDDEVKLVVSLAFVETFLIDASKEHIRVILINCCAILLDERFERVLSRFIFVKYHAFVLPHFFLNVVG